MINAMANASNDHDMLGDLNCATPAEDGKEMERVCARFLTANVKKTPAMVELLRKDKTREEEAEVMAAIGAAVRESMAEMGVAENP